MSVSPTQGPWKQQPPAQPLTEPPHRDARNSRCQHNPGPLHKDPGQRMTPLAPWELCRPGIKAESDKSPEPQAHTDSHTAAWSGLCGNHPVRGRGKVSDWGTGQPSPGYMSPSPQQDQPPSASLGAWPGPQTQPKEIFSTIPADPDIRWPTSSTAIPGGPQRGCCRH